MPAQFTLSAQLHSFPPLIERMGLQEVIESVRRSVDTAGIEILIPGGVEIPALYHALTSGQDRPARWVFLWFPVLADYPGFQPAHRVINYKGVPSPGWGIAETQEKVGETFQFACPNRPEVAGTVLAELGRQLREYPFDGVFLDKIRFPSPANGLADVLTCFCPTCRQAAASEGLDLSEVRAALLSIHPGSWPRQASALPASGGDWLDELLAGQELLQRFMRFRADSVTTLVSQLSECARSLGRQVALDLFSPSLGRLVGQDFSHLAPLAAWIKPMSYSYANGPAGLRLEIPSLMKEISSFLGIPLDLVEAWARERVPRLATGGAGSISTRIASDGAPFDLIAAETRQAVEISSTTPVYMGVEAVSIPAFQIHTTPEYVRRTLALARSCGAAGAVLSWDVLNMPLENLQAARMEI
jgi:hypothetical protein